MPPQLEHRGQRGLEVGLPTCPCLHFTGEETEAWRADESCLESYNSSTTEHPRAGPGGLLCTDCHRSSPEHFHLPQATLCTYQTPTPYSPSPTPGHHHSFCLCEFDYSAKSRQSCPTLCDPIDGSPPGSSVPGILQARTLEWVKL